MRAAQFGGYAVLKLVELPKPAATDGKVLVRITAAGVTPLDHTNLFGNCHIPEVPLVLGNEGAGVVEEGGGTDFPAGSRGMFWGTYGAFEDGSYRVGEADDIAQAYLFLMLEGFGTGQAVVVDGGTVLV